MTTGMPPAQQNTKTAQLRQIGSHSVENIILQSSEVIAVTGPNGVGKSALLHEIALQIGSNEVELLSGHRQIAFGNDDFDQIGMKVSDVRTQLRSQPQQNNRYRNAWGEIHLKSFVKRAISREQQQAISIILAQDTGSTLI